MPKVGEIRMLACSFAPAGWMLCDGTPLPISENETLFNVIGTIYGGDGQETFNLPNLSSRIPMHMDSSATIGETGGTEQETLTVNQIPSHNHAMIASDTNALTPIPTANVFASPTAIDTYRPVAPNTPFVAQSVGPAGGSQPHENMHPFLCINFIISLFGEFPHT